MPLEIREIGIHMRVGEGERPALPGAAAAINSEEEREEIVDECVRRVLAMLKTQQER
jgi:hypothetical protein